MKKSGRCRAAVRRLLDPAAVAVGTPWWWECEGCAYESPAFATWRAALRAALRHVGLVPA